MTHFNQPPAQTIDLDGPVHYIDHPGPAGAPTVVLVHGLGASKLSWVDMAPKLAETHRVLIPDLVGFGDSEPLGRSSTVRANSRLLGRFVRKLADGPVTLVGNSMGGMVSVLLARAHPSLVSHLVLVDGAMPLSIGSRTRPPDRTVGIMFLLYSLPVIGERFMRSRRDTISPEQQVTDLIDLVTADSSRISPDTVATMISQAEHRRGYPWSESAFLKAERSLIRTLLSPRVRFSDVLADIQQPTLVVHGVEDRLVDVGAARAAVASNPRMALVELPGVGHAPQLEVPDLLVTTMRNWAPFPSSPNLRVGRPTGA